MALARKQRADQRGRRFRQLRRVAKRALHHGEAAGEGEHDRRGAAYADYCVFGMVMWAHCTGAIELLEPGDPVAAWRDRLRDAFDGLARQSATATQVSR